MPDMANTDVSGITDLPGGGEYQGCSPGAHNIIRNPKDHGQRICKWCGYSVQTLVDWWRQDPKVVLADA